MTPKKATSDAVLFPVQVTAEKMSSGPDGLYVINAISCQQSCAANPTCKKFTWKGDTAPLKGCLVDRILMMSVCVSHNVLDLGNLEPADG